MNILAISSQVVAGHVGNSAAQFVLQVLGHEVWALPTVLLSHHPGHGKPAGRATSPDEMQSLLDSLWDGGWMDDIDAVMTGYFASAAQVEQAATCIARLKTTKPHLPVLVDPIIGDADISGKSPPNIYVAADVPKAIRTRLMPLATLTTPNLFELSYLTDHDWPLHDRAIIEHAAHSLAPVETLVTSVPGSSAGTIATLAFDGDDLIVSQTPLRMSPPNGVGDVTASTYFGNRLNNVAPRPAIAAATTTVSGLIDMAARMLSNELPLIEGRHLIVDASKGN